MDQFFKSTPDRRHDGLVVTGQCFGDTIVLRDMFVAVIGDARIQLSRSFSFPYCWQAGRLWSIRLRHNEAARLGHVKDPSIRDHGTEAFT